MGRRDIFCNRDLLFVRDSAPVRSPSFQLTHGELVIDGRTLFPRASHIEFLVRMVFLATFSSSVYVLGLDSNVFYALLRSTRWAARDPRTWFRN